MWPLEWKVIGGWISLVWSQIWLMFQTLSIHFIRNPCTDRDQTAAVPNKVTAEGKKTWHVSSCCSEQLMVGPAPGLLMRSSRWFKFEVRKKLNIFVNEFLWLWRFLTVQTDSRWDLSLLLLKVLADRWLRRVFHVISMVNWLTQVRGFNPAAIRYFFIFWFDVKSFKQICEFWCLLFELNASCSFSL